MKTAGVIFDFYDDPKGEVLKSVFPTADELPQSIKIAHILSPEERDVLRDDAFAMVATNDGKLLRKFACVDKGNTILSALYFDKVAHLLPEDLRESVDARIKEAIYTFNLAEKTASSMMPRAPGGPGRFIGKRIIPKKLSGEELKKATAKAEEAFFSKGPKMEEGIKRKAASAIFDLSNHNPVELIENAVEKTAMDGRYPLDSYSDVKTAIAYFDTNWAEMDPSDRREYCVKTAARANELGIKIAESMIRYASTTYADDVDAHLANRRAHSDEKFHELYDMLQEKRAELQPEEFASALGEVDKVAGVDWLYGGEVCDHYLSTFGGLGQEKTASFKVANKEITDEQLQELAARDGLKGVFDFSDDFNKDPVSIFASLPDDAKSVIAGLV